MNAHLTKQRPPRTPLYADWLLPLLAAQLGLGTCLFLSVQDERQIKRAPAYFGGWLLGLALPRLYRHRYRILGTIPYLAAMLVIWIIVHGPTPNWPVYAVGVAGLLGGLCAGAILRYRDRFKSYLKHFYGLSVLSAGIGIGLVAYFSPVIVPAYDWAYLATAIVLFLLSMLTLTRAMIEFFFENSFRVLYHVRTKGTEPAQIPHNGPLIVIANHAQWFDPLFLAKFLPRETTPMMTSAFYDLPVLRFLMRRVFHTIRVDERPMRREVPEIQEALAALDAGKCLVIFPEGFLRRQDDQILRRFGRGIWQILQARPDIPVLACWIEGSWGSYFSHYNGPPTKNKRLDRFHTITIGIHGPALVPAELLKDHLKTRAYLMQQVLLARELLGLPAASVPELSTSGEVDAGAGI